jgi:hypothetical protein
LIQDEDKRIIQRKKLLYFHLSKPIGSVLKGVDVGFVEKDVNIIEEIADIKKSSGNY